MVSIIRKYPCVSNFHLGLNSDFFVCVFWGFSLDFFRKTRLSPVSASFIGFSGWCQFIIVGDWLRMFILGEVRIHKGFSLCCSPPNGLICSNAAFTVWLHWSKIDAYIAEMYTCCSHLKSLQKGREVGISSMRFISLKEKSNKGCFYCAPELSAFWQAETWVM